MREEVWKTGTETQWAGGARVRCAPGRLEGGGGVRRELHRLQLSTLRGVTES